MIVVAKQDAWWVRDATVSSEGVDIEALRKQFEDTDADLRRIWAEQILTCEPDRLVAQAQVSVAVLALANEYLAKAEW